MRRRGLHYHGLQKGESAEMQSFNSCRAGRRWRRRSNSRKPGRIDYRDVDPRPEQAEDTREERGVPLSTSRPTGARGTRRAHSTSSRRQTNALRKAVRKPVAPYTIHLAAANDQNHRGAADAKDQRHTNSVVTAPHCPHSCNAASITPTVTMIEPAPAESREGSRNTRAPIEACDWAERSARGRPLLVDGPWQE